MCEWPGRSGFSACGDANGDAISDAKQTEEQLGENPPDGVLILGRPKCSGSNNGACDDNCPTVYNPNQEDMITTGSAIL